MVLFSMGGLFALYEGIEKLRHPHEVESIWVGIAILLIAIVLESWSLRTAVKEANHTKRAEISWWRFIRTSKQPELPVVLLEDTGAEIGLAVRAVRPADGALDGRRPLGRAGLGGDRPAADHDRDHPHGRDEGTADRRGGEQGRPGRDRGRDPKRRRTSKT